MISRLRPNPAKLDPNMVHARFSHGLCSLNMLKVRNDLMILPVAIEWKSDLSIGQEVKSLEIPWEYLGQEIKDRGSYLLVLTLEREKFIEIGRLGKVIAENPIF